MACGYDKTRISLFSLSRSCVEQQCAHCGVRYPGQGNLFSLCYLESSSYIEVDVWFGAGYNFFFIFHPSLTC